MNTQNEIIDGIYSAERDAVSRDSWTAVFSIIKNDVRAEIYGVTNTVDSIKPLRVAIYDICF